MSKCNCVNTANSCDMREGCQVQARIAKSISEQQDKANQRLRTNEALEEENAELKATIDKLVDNLKEMDIYLNHGHGTSIGCDSIFHREIKGLINSVTEGK